MNTLDPVETEQPGRGALPELGEDVVSNSDGRGLEGEIDLLEASRTLWAGRWLILSVTLAFASIGAAYAWLAAPWYRAEVLLIAAENRGEQGLLGQLGQVGGLASLAGIALGSIDRAEPLAILRSRDFAAAFIDQRGLIPVLFADQMGSTRPKWWPGADYQPDIRDAVEFFDKRVRRVSEDRKSGLVSLVVEWKDAEEAAAWANEMAKEINRQTRERALKTAAANIAYLQSEMKSTSIVSLQQSIGRLLESEMQKLMLARGNEEFAFRVIDKARVPRKSFRPQPLMAIATASIAGFIFCTFFLLLRESYRLRMRHG